MLEIALAKPTLSDHLKEDYIHMQGLFSVQSALVKSHLELQGNQLAEALIKGRSQVSFSLPDRILCTLENSDRFELRTISQDHRSHSVGSPGNHPGRVELENKLCALFNHLEHSQERAVVLAAQLLRYTVALNIVHNLLPAGKNGPRNHEDRSELMLGTPGALARETSSTSSDSDGVNAVGVKTAVESKELSVSSVPLAERFFLPRWVAFNENGGLVVKSVEEAEVFIKDMQGFMDGISLAVSLVPYISADKEYIRKRYGMLHQLVNQGRAFAMYHTNDIITVIKARAASGQLNRGLSLSLPYFNDQELTIDIREIEIIPAGLVMFVPAFVVLAVRREEMLVDQDRRLNSSTRKHLLSLLGSIGQAFEAS